MRSGEQKPAKPKDKEVKKLNIAGRTFHSKTPANNKEEPVRQSSFYFLKSMLDTILNPVSYKDKNGIYLGINETFARQVIGLPEEEIVGFTLPEICRKLVERFPEKDKVNGKKLTEICSEYDQDDIELLKSGGKKVQEQEMILADGTKKTFLVNKSTFRDENGNIFGLVTVLQDITMLKESEKSLEETEERYRIVTQQTGQLVYDNDLQNGRLYWAGAVEEVFGVQHGRG